MTEAKKLTDLQKVGAKTAKEAGGTSVLAFFEQQKSTLAAVLPKHVSPDRMMRLAMGALRSNPKLAQAKVNTLFGALIQCSQLGLEPNTPLGHAYLIPFEKRAKQGNQWVTTGTEVQIIFGYKGLIDLARRSGQIVSISAHEVCEGDHFVYQYGLDEKLEHRPAATGRGQVTHYYAVAKLVGGGHAFEVMTLEQVNEIRDKAAEKNRAKRDNNGNFIITGPWADHPIEMGRKTVLRRLFKYLPISIELATAAQLDGSAGYREQNLDGVLDGTFEVVENPYAQNAAEQEDQAPAIAQDDNEPLDLTAQFEPSAEEIAAAQAQQPEQAAEPRTTPRRQQRNLDVE